MRWIKLFESFKNYEEVKTNGYLGGDDYSRIVNDIDELISYLEENWELFTDNEIKEIKKLIPEINKTNLEPNWRSIYHSSEEQKEIINKYFYLSNYKPSNGWGFPPSSVMVSPPHFKLDIYKTKDEWYWASLRYVDNTNSWRNKIYKCDQFDGLLNFLRDGISFLFLTLRA
jgi:hypothetical protein